MFGQAKRYCANLGGGGNDHRARPPKPVLRPQKVGLVWSVPISSKENDRAQTNGGGGNAS